MRNINKSAQILIILLLAAGCAGKGSRKIDTAVMPDTLTVPDTGYTGIKKYFSGNLLIKEVTFKNGIREGEMKTYYQGGQLYQTFWYQNGYREDTARWYYLEGQVFRATPYRLDTIDGTQIQYYRNGRVKAKLNYEKGLRTPFIEEYTQDGKLISDYPEVVSTITDNYNTSGKVRISFELSNKSEKVKFYQGEFYNGVFDTVKCTRLKSNDGRAFLDLKKSGTPQQDHIGIIAAIITNFGNNYLTYKKIELPYKDLK